MFASTVIPVFSLLEIHDQDICSLLLFLFDEGEETVFCVDATFVAP
jgi:hypothetical protein